MAVGGRLNKEPVGTLEQRKFTDIRSEWGDVVCEMILTCEPSEEEYRSDIYECGYMLALSRANNRTVKAAVRCAVVEREKSRK